MKHITYTDKSLLVGNEAADTLLQYAAILADNARADIVNVRAFGSDGDEVTATFLLDAGASIMAETSTSRAKEPDNDEAVAYMRKRMSLLTEPPAARFEDADSPNNYEDLGL